MGTHLSEADRIKMASSNANMWMAHRLRHAKELGLVWDGNLQHVGKCIFCGKNIYHLDGYPPRADEFLAIGYAVNLNIAEGVWVTSLYCHLNACDGPDCCMNSEEAKDYLIWRDGPYCDCDYIEIIGPVSPSGSTPETTGYYDINNNE
jgi:hypothetical protein